eukprot:scaffold304613_cov33-Tisochrysis_lutea.AAC.5
MVNKAYLVVGTRDIQYTNTLHIARFSCNADSVTLSTPLRIPPALKRMLHMFRRVSIRCDPSPPHHTRPPLPLLPLGRHVFRRCAVTHCAAMHNSFSKLVLRLTEGGGLTIGGSTTCANNNRLTISLLLPPLSPLGVTIH